MRNIIDVSGKTVLITGGYGYLGNAIVRGFIDSRAIVYVLGRKKTQFEDTFSDIISNNRLFFKECDVSDTMSIQTAFTEINADNPINVLINNAFYSKGTSPELMSDEDWAFGIDGTLNSCFRCIREVIPYLKHGKGSRIINVSSMYGVVAPQFEVYEDFPMFLNPPHYGASKAGVIQLTKYYASFLGKYGITVNSITPGPFPSASVQLHDKFIKNLASKTCLNRIGRPEDLVGSFIFLASNAADFITGHNLIVDGGWTVK